MASLVPLCYTSQYEMSCRNLEAFMALHARRLLLTSQSVQCRGPQSVGRLRRLGGQLPVPTALHLGKPARGLVPNQLAPLHVSMVLGV